ncbi:MAG: acyl carrier protein [Chromatiaceae bacterium]|nr:acyl carrier protein [Chromatiaceae bacterium]
MTEDRMLYEVASLIIETLQLENIKPEDIGPDAPLFGDGLGLDSIDALELALAISRTYAVTLSSEDPNLRTVFASLRSLSAHIQAQHAV